MKIFLVFALLILSSCLKAPSTEVEKGPSADCRDIDAALGKVQLGSVQSIKKGEFVSIDSKTRLDIQPFEVIKQQALEVTDKKDDVDPNYNEITILETLNEKTDSGSFKQSQNVKKYYIEKAPTTLKVMVTSASSSERKSMCDYLSKGTLSYNKLNVSENYVEIPIAVQKQAQCGGLASCAQPLKAVQVSFDRWVLDDEGKEMKVSSFITASPDVPYFSTILSNCFQYSVTIQDRPLLVTTCEEVKDFKFGN